MSRWQPTATPAAATRRAAMQRRIHAYFQDQQVLHVDTPALSAAAVSDPQIESMEVRSTLANEPWYLQTSPEYYMKRLLAAGYPDIYSICRVFRDGESGRLHQPEFTMIEWYRHGYGLQQIIADAAAAISSALADARPFGALQQHNYRDLFVAVTGLDPFTCATEQLADAIDADADLRESIGDERHDWLDLVFTQCLQPSFADDRLTVVKHYPLSQAALAQQCPSDASVADRFEIFVGQVELANGYVELTDAAEQQRRIERDQAERRRRGRAVRKTDAALIEALRHGLPACAGVAMGLERLQMIHDRTDDMRDVITFTAGTE